MNSNIEVSGIICSHKKKLYELRAKDCLKNVWNQRTGAILKEKSWLLAWYLIVAHHSDAMKKKTFQYTRRFDIVGSALDALETVKRQYPKIITRPTRLA